MCKCSLNFFINFFFVFYVVHDLTFFYFGVSKPTSVYFIVNYAELCLNEGVLYGNDFIYLLNFLIIMNYIMEAVDCT